MTKILLVEDDKSLREIYNVRLRAEGYDIVAAGDGEEALALAIKERPDLIVSDVMMPKISGFDMLDILRSTTETKNVKVIMMTALSSEEQRQRGLSLGADRYLVKSQVGIEDVVRTVHEILGDTTSAASGPAPLNSNASAQPQAPVQPTANVQVSATKAPVTQPTAPVVAPPVNTRPNIPNAQIPATQTPVPTINPLPQPGSLSMTTPPTQPPQSQPIASSTSATGQNTTQSTPAESSLPQPTAPFSTPRPGSSGRIIKPLSTGNEQPIDFTARMSQELADVQSISSIPQPVANTQAPTTPQPVAQMPQTSTSVSQTQPILAPEVEGIAGSAPQAMPQQQVAPTPVTPAATVQTPESQQPVAAVTPFTNNSPAQPAAAPSGLEFEEISRQNPQTPPQPPAA